MSSVCDNKVNDVPNETSIRLWPGFEKYFELTDGDVSNAKDVKSFKVKCLSCKKVVSTGVRSSYNLKQHIANVHASLKKEFESHIAAAIEQKKRKNESEPSGSKTKQPKVTQMIQTPAMTQKRYDKLVMDAVIRANLSTRVVEDVCVKKLLHELQSSTSSIFKIGRTALTNKIKRTHFDLIKQLLCTLESVRFTCLTADCWTSHRRRALLFILVSLGVSNENCIRFSAFIGVTCHWIDRNTFERQSVSLCCCRIEGSHTGVKLAVKLDKIITDFKLNGKVVSVVTDNASNFSKAFRLEELPIDGEHEQDEDDDIEDIDDIAIDQDSGVFEETFELLSSLNETQSSCVLHPHKRCAAHTFSLMMTTDVKKITDENFKQYHETSISKCVELFKKQTASSKAADFIKQKLGKYFVTPVITRWNSMIDSLKAFLALIDAKPLEVESVFEHFKLSKLTRKEVAFLKEYLKVLEIVANALDIMQGEKFMTMGLYSPTLLQVQSKLDQFKKLEFCQPLVERLQSSLTERFPDMLNNENLKAAILHPFFKNFAFMKEKRGNTRLRNEILDELADEMAELDLFKEQSKRVGSSSINVDLGNLRIIKDFFSNGAQNQVSSVESTLSPSEILSQYVCSSDVTMNFFTSFPLVKELFLKYNSAIPSSAPCERLFSAAKHVLTSYRCKLSDEHFKQRLLLKVNKY